MTVQATRPPTIMSYEIKLSLDNWQLSAPMKVKIERNASPYDSIFFSFEFTVNKGRESVTCIRMASLVICRYRLPVRDSNTHALYIAKAHKTKSMTLKRNSKATLSFETTTATTLWTNWWCACLNRLQSLLQHLFQMYLSFTSCLERN